MQLPLLASSSEGSVIFSGLGLGEELLDLDLDITLNRKKRKLRNILFNLQLFTALLIIII